MRERYGRNQRGEVLKGREDKIQNDKIGRGRSDFPLALLVILCKSCREGFSFDGLDLPDIVAK